MRSSLKRRQEQNAESGFTLIEILVVILILAILAAIVVFAVQSLGGETAKASCKGDFKNVESAVETYKAQVGHYPKSGDNAAATPGGTQIAGGLAGQPAGSGLDAVYTSQVNQTGGLAGPWLKDVPTNGNHYTFVVSSDGTGTITLNDAAGAGQTNCSGVQ